MEQKSKNWLLLGLLGLAGLIVWKSSKAKSSDGFKDKELGKLVDDLKKMPDLEKAMSEQSWIDKRPTYDMTCFPKKWEDALSMPECADMLHVKNAHLIKKGWGAPLIMVSKDVKDLTKDEFEKAGYIMVDGQIMPKAHYIDYILKPQPTEIAKAVQQKLDEIQKVEPSEPKVLVPVASPIDPLYPVASSEVISRYDPDRVMEISRLGQEIGYTGVRQPQVIASTIGTAYSETIKKDGIVYGFPIEGATISQTISGNDGTLLYKNDYVMRSGVLIPIN